jgi:hypothetical protein
MRPNNALICVIILQITFIIWFRHKSELLKERIADIIPDDVTMYIGFIIIIVSLCMSYYISHVIQFHYKINYVIIMIFIWTNILIYMEYKMSPIHCKTTDEEDVQTALDKSRTGDFVFTRSYVSNNVGHYIVFRALTSIINGNGTPFYGHVGMIVKINNVAYIMELSSNFHHCIYANKLKSGVKLTNARDRIDKCFGRVYLSRNNLHNYIRYEDIIKFMDTHGNISFFDNNMLCITIICMFLHFINVFKPERKYIMSVSELTNPELYSCDFKNIETVELKTKYYYDNLQNKL